MKELISARPELLISVVGVGGCGCNTLNMLCQNELPETVRLIAVNTDLAVLNHSQVESKILIGEHLTKGYGAGADPAVGLKAAQESEEALRAAIDGSDVVIITAGFGKGTGTGASPFVAELAKEMGIASLAVVTLPFESESLMRMNFALSGIEQIKTPVQAYITLSNDLLLKGLSETIGLFSAFKHSNDVLNNLLTALVQMLTIRGEMNVDMNDFAKILSFEGESVLGVGKAQTQDQAFDALEQALNNPLVSNADIAYAEGVIVQICCKQEPSLAIYDGLLSEVKRKLKKETALIISGVMLMDSLSCELEILVIGCGITAPESPEIDVTTDKSNASRGESLSQDYINEELAFLSSEEGYSSEESYTDIPTLVRKQLSLKTNEK